MAIAREDAGSVRNTSTVTSQIVVPWDGGAPTDGWYMLAFGASREQRTASITDWGDPIAEVQSLTQGWIALFAKVASSEGSSVTIDLSGNSRKAGIVIAYSDVDGTDPLGEILTGEGDSDSFAFTGLTIENDGATAVAFSGGSNGIDPTTVVWDNSFSGIKAEGAAGATNGAWAIAGDKASQSTGDITGGATQDAETSHFAHYIATSLNPSGGAPAANILPMVNARMYA